ncbi:MAG: 4-hydroxythreonine-4-phosphate dehydrogenase PdxA [Woeseiaceae bacterium]
MVIALTTGEPAGIGPEICVAAAMESLPAPIVAIGDPEVLAARARLINANLTLVPAEEKMSTEHQPGRLPYLATPFAVPDCLGVLHTENAQALLDGLDLAVAGCLSGRFSAMVTAPLQKSIIADAGVNFSGHTEYLAERCGTKLPVMLLAGKTIRVALATTHMPLRAVPDALTDQLLTDTIDVLYEDLKTKFSLTSPEIAVCGLNPHAGEGGHLGHEDDAIIAPVIARQREAGRNIHGPYPADTIFNHAGENADAILAMYHDQGLPVIKFAGFGDIVNITLGLPIIRTSVDHGSALNIAGTGKASATSLISAIELAAELSRSSTTV